MSEKLLNILKKLPVTYCKTEETAKALLKNKQSACVPTIVEPNPLRPPLIHLCFDFDGVLAILDENEDGSEEEHVPFEWLKEKTLHQQGIFFQVYKSLVNATNVKVSIINTRGVAENKKVFNSLNSWGISSDNVFALKNENETDLLLSLKADFYFTSSLYRAQAVLKSGVNVGWVPMVNNH